MFQEWNRKLTSSEIEKSDLDERMQQLFSRHGITVSCFSLVTHVVCAVDVSVYDHSC